MMSDGTCQGKLTAQSFRLCVWVLTYYRIITSSALQNWQKERLQGLNEGHNAASHSSPFILQGFSDSLMAEHFKTAK